MWSAQDKYFLHVKRLNMIRRWRRLNLDTVVQTAGFLLLLVIFWFLCYNLIAKLCENLIQVEIIGPILLKRIVSFGFFALLILVTGGHVLTAYSSLFRSNELQQLLSSPYPPHRLYRIQCIETLVLGGWLLGLFCIPILFAYGWELQAPWWYFLVVLIGLGGFMVIAAGLGILIVLFITRWIIGRPIRTALAAVILLAGFTVLFFYSVTQTQGFIENVDAAKLGETLANLRLSSNPYVPSQWMSELMTAARIDDLGKTGFYLFLIWTTALFLMSIVFEIGYRWYPNAWLWAQERVGLFQKRRDPQRYRPKKLWLMRLFPRRVGSIVYKEFHVFARDFSQWGQLVLILVLVLFYVAHTKNIAMGNTASPARSHLAFFNVVLLGFIQATLSLRYTYPSISLEGKGFWTVVTSEVGISRFYFTKYYLHALVLLAIGQGMIFMLNNFLDIDPTLNLICAFVLFLFSFGFTSWTLGFGAIFHKFEATNAAEVTSDVGTLVAMICTLLYFGVSIAFLARFALDHTPGMNIIDQMTIQPEMILYSTFFLLIQTCCILLPTAYGLKKLQQASF